MADIQGNQGAKALNANQVAAVAIHSGFKADDAVVMVAIAKAESSFITNNRGGPNSDGSYDYGLWMINSRLPGGPPKWQDPVVSGRYAFLKHRTQGFNAWCVWESSACGGNGNGSYRQFLPEARKAVQDITTMPDNGAALYRAIKNQDWDLDAPYSTGISGAIGDAGNAVTGAVDAAGQLLEVFEELTKGETWVRIGEVVGGLVLVGLALALISKDLLPNPVGGALKAVT